MQFQESDLSDVFEKLAKVYDISERYNRFAIDTMGAIDEEAQELESPDIDLPNQAILEEKRFNLKLKKLCSELIAYSAQISRLYGDINRPKADVVPIAKKIAEISLKQDETMGNITEMLERMAEGRREPEDEKCCCCCSLM